MSIYKTRFGSSMVMAAGAAFAGAGVVNTVHHNTNGEDVVGLAGHLSLALFAVALILVPAGFIALMARELDRTGVRSRRPSVQVCSVSPASPP